MKSNLKVQRENQIYVNYIDADILVTTGQTPTNAASK